MNRNELALDYLLQSSQYLQLHLDFLAIAKNASTSQQYVNLLSASVYHALYSFYLKKASARLQDTSLSEDNEREALDNAQNALDQALAGQGNVDQALAGYASLINTTFNLTVIDQFTGSVDYPATKHLALKRYRKGLEDMAIWLKQVYCQTVPGCTLNQYQVFRDVIGSLTLIRMNNAAQILAQNQFRALAADVIFEPPRGYTTDHVVHEFYGFNRYLSDGSSLSPASQQTVCSRFTDKCTEGIPNNIDFTVTDIKNAMEAGNFTHELSHIFVNSSGFGQYTVSSIYQGNPEVTNPIIGTMNDILNDGDDQGSPIYRYNGLTDVSETIANFLGALAVGNRDNTIVPDYGFEARNDGFQDGLGEATTVELAALNYQAGGNFIDALVEMILINVLRNTSPQSLAEIIGVDFFTTVTLSGSFILRTLPSANASNLPLGAAGIVIALANNEVGDWIYVGVPRGQGDRQWYDYGWINESANPYPLLEQVSIEGVLPFSLRTTEIGGLGLVFTQP